MPSAVRPTSPPFLRFDARTGWPLGGDASRSGVHATGDALMIGVAGRRAIPLAEPYGTFGGRTLPRGVAISGDGRLFVADPERREVLTLRAGEPGHPGLVPLWEARPLPEQSPPDLHPPMHPPADPYTLVRPTDVALSPRGDLVLADAGAGRILVLAFPSARLRRVVELPGGTPTALAFDGSGRAYVADPIMGTVHRYDAAWRRDLGFPHSTVRLGAPAHVAAVAVARPQDAATAGTQREGARVLVLDGSRVVGLDDRGREVAADPLVGLAPPPLRRAGDDSLLYDDPAMPWAHPIRFSGIELTRDGRSVATGRPLLALPRRVELPRSGSFTTVRLDGGRPGFEWDRIALRVDVPPSTRLLVRTLASDSAIELDRILAMPDDAWAPPLPVHADDVPELLIQSDGGRYLWLRVELFGDGTATPRITGIDVFGPRRSSVRHLPESFHQDRESLRFLDRYLAYFDTVFAEISATDREAATLFDPWAVPAGAALDWLGSWFDLRFLAEWSPEVRRRMIAEALVAARERGTAAGLQRILQRHTGLEPPMPQVIEHFRLGPDDHVPIGGEPLPGPSEAHRCTVVLPETVVPDVAARERIERLVADHVPGHVRVDLRLVVAGIRVGRQATIGIDTLLGPPSSGALGEARLGEDLTTAAPRPRAALVRTRRPLTRSQPC